MKNGHALFGLILFLMGAVIILMFFMLPEYMTDIERLFVLVLGFVFIIGSTAEMISD